MKDNTKSRSSDTGADIKKQLRLALTRATLLAVLAVSVGFIQAADHAEAPFSATSNPCFSDQDCHSGRQCFFPVGSCGEDEQAGRCGERPACSDFPRPACGCDGITYRNFCSAAAAGVSVRYAGECVK